MGLFDDVKDSISGSDSKNEKNSDFESGKFNSSFDSSSNPDMNNDPSGSSGNPPERFDSGGLEPEDPLADDPGGNPPPNNLQGSQRQENPPMNNGGGNDFQPQSSNLGGRNDSPNPRAGRPREGSSTPELSSETRQEMENAGFNMGSDQRAAPQDQGFDRSGSVADQRDDLQEIKSQNEQIIELLKRISDALNSGNQGMGGSRNRHGGRR